MQVLSWNVNGVRAVAQKGFLDWLAHESPDVLCLQETKASPDQLDSSLLAPLGYSSHWAVAKKPGYSGVAIYVKSSDKKKSSPKITEGLGVSAFDDEGRVLRADFGDVSVISAYFPNSQREHTRLGYKLEFCDAMLSYVQKLVKEGRNVVLCGDYNIAHREIDLKNPKTNINNAGFLPEERAWMTKFLEHGWVDTFRDLHGDQPGHYTWWSYRPGVREKNIGWRIDYHCVNERFRKSIAQSWIMPEVFGSDHCPVGIKIG